MSPRLPGQGPSLGGKRVVLKVSLDKGQEPKTQGVLDHPHIVPVNSVAFQLDRGLRGLSMPFRQGLPLDEIVKRVRPGDRPRLARRLWEVLVQSTATGTLPPCSRGTRRAPPRRAQGRRLERLPGARDLRTGRRLGRDDPGTRLHYAHGMQTFHRDVKPGNVLITIHHGPQLLDFNLAESPHSADHAESAMLGGTLPYMAPEQIEAFLNPDLWGSVGAKADLYSLGLVLRELLTGQAPDLPNDKLPPARSMRKLLDRRACLPTDVRRYVPEIPHALDAIVGRCLAFNAKDRYPDGRGLAEDLERFLNRKPLHHVTNPSRRERVANWAARNGKSLAAAAFTIMLGTMIGFLASPSIRNHLKPPLESVAAYRQARLDIEQGRYDEGIRKLEGLQADYPAHPFLLLYLSRAHVERPQLPGDEAHRYFQKVMESPDGEHALREWAAHDPGAVKHLEKMGTTWADNLYVSSAYRNDTAAKSPADSTNTARDQRTATGVRQCHPQGPRSRPRARPLGVTAPRRSRWPKRSWKDMKRLTETSPS